MLMNIIRRFRTSTKKIYGVSRSTHTRSGLQLSVLAQEKLDGTPHFDLEITEENVDEMAKVIIKHIKKSWNVNKLRRQDFKGGLSNKVFGYLPVARKGRFGKYETYKPSDMILIRVYGEKTDVVKDHDKEVRNIDELSKNNLAPPLYCTFSNGFCWEFIEGKVLSPSDFKNRNILRLTASCMAELHTVELSDDYLDNYKMEPTLFNDIASYLDAIPSHYNAELQKRFESQACPVEKLRDEVAAIFEVVSTFENMTVTYCHNDFHPINLIFNERKGTMSVVDHERGSPNFSAYDIGNYFNEFAGIRDLDYNLYPTQETQYWWLRLYLQRVNKLNDSDEVITNSDVRELSEQVRIMSMVSQLFWVAWSLFRAGYPVSDFDYMGYGITRLNEYYRQKRNAQRSLVIR